MAANSAARLALCSVLLGVLAACSGEDGDDDNPDAGDGPVADGGGLDDGGLDDGGLDDAGLDDAGLDGGLDAGENEAGAADAGGLDGGADASTDGGLVELDAGEQDAGVDGGEPDAGPCVPSDELCNAVDDDCDGLTDEGLLAMSADDSRSWDLPNDEELADEQRGFSQLLARGDSGAWLLTKALPLSDGLNGIDVAALDASGATVGDVQTILPLSRVFLAASLDDYLAVLWRDTDNDGDSSPADLASTSTRVTLFEAAGDGSLLELDTFDLAGPSDISEVELQRTAGGELRMLLAYAPFTDLTNGTLGRTVLHTLRLDTSTNPDELATVATLELPANARPTVHALKRPCEAGWLLGYWTNNGDNTQAERVIYFRPMSLDGELDVTAEPLFSIDAHALQGFAAAPEQCADAATPLLVLADSPDTSPPKNLEAYQLSFSHDDGSISLVDTTVVVENTAFSRIAYYGGQWYVTVRNFATVPTGVYELNVLTDTARNIATPEDQGGLSGLTTVDVNMYFIPTHGILTVGDGMLVAFSNARPWESPLGRETVAVTHRLTCQ